MTMSISVMPTNNCYMLLQLIIHSPKFRLFQNQNIQVTHFYYLSLKQLDMPWIERWGQLMSMSKPTMPNEVLLYPIATHHPPSICWLHKAHNKNTQVSCFEYPLAQTTWYVKLWKERWGQFKSTSRHVILDEVPLYPIATHHPLSSWQLYKVHNIQVTCFDHPPAQMTWCVTKERWIQFSVQETWVSQLCPMMCGYPLATHHSLPSC